jgi:hypothetical protein
MTASYVEHYQVSAAGLVKDRAHFITTITIAVEPTMLEFHARPRGR